MDPLISPEVPGYRAGGSATVTDVRGSVLSRSLAGVSAAERPTRNTDSSCKRDELRPTAVDGCVEPQIFGEQSGGGGHHQGEGSRWRFGLWPQLGLSLVAGVVVAIELLGVVVPEPVGEFVEEVEHFRCGFFGEAEWQGDGGRDVLVHGPASHDARALAFRCERALASRSR